MEFDMEWDFICRICLQEGEMCSVFDSFDGKVTHSQKIMQCSNITIIKGSNLPEQICEKCLINLNVAYHFRLLCERSNKMLQSLMKENMTDIVVNASTDSVYTYKPPEGLTIKRVKNVMDMEIKVEEPDYVEETESKYFDDIDSKIMEETEPEAEPEPKIIDETELKIVEETESRVIEDTEATEPTEEIEPKVIEEFELQNIEENEFDDVIIEYVEEEDVSDAERYCFIEDENDIIEKFDPGTTIKVEDDSQGEKPTSERKKRPYRYIRRQKGRKTTTKKDKDKSQISSEKVVHICDICGNVYKQRSKLETHLRRHRNERTFPCEVCGKSFYLNVELKLHMRRHTGDKPYPCKYCDRRFTDWGCRMRHERMHTGERPYVCKTCGKGFIHSYGLSNHMFVHTGEKPFLCELCRKRFVKKHHLKAHLQTHQRRGDFVDIVTMLAAQPKMERDEFVGNSEDENAVANLDMIN